MIAVPPVCGANLSVNNSPFIGISHYAWRQHGNIYLHIGALYAANRTLFRLGELQRCPASLQSPDRLRAEQLPPQAWQGLPEELTIRERHPQSVRVRRLRVRQLSRSRQPWPP